MKYLVLFFITTSAFAGNLQNADFATSAYITGAGGAVSQLLNSSKMYNDVDSEIMDTSIARWDAKLSSPVSLTTQVSGILPLANGGTNAALTAANGAIPYSTATAFAFLAPGNSGQVLTSGGAGAPTWTTPTAALVPEEEVPAGTVNSSNVTFTTSVSIAAAKQLAVYQDGLILNQGVDYTVVIATGVITMTTAPLFGQTVYVKYYH